MGAGGGSEWKFFAEFTGQQEFGEVAAPQRKGRRLLPNRERTQSGRQWVGVLVKGALPVVTWLILFPVFLQNSTLWGKRSGWKFSRRPNPLRGSPRPAPPQPSGPVAATHPLRATLHAPPPAFLFLKPFARLPQPPTPVPHSLQPTGTISLGLSRTSKRHCLIPSTRFAFSTVCGRGKDLKSLQRRRM